MTIITRHLFPVRVERSRDTSEDSVVPMGISTSLDANGTRVYAPYLSCTAESF